MVDYYQILGVKQTASAAEIKSAYRRLARERHPDVNNGSEEAAREFALLALAYRTLNDPQERAYYDAHRGNPATTSGDSVIHSNNIHAQRMRKAAAQARWDRAVDLWLEADRRETFARTQAVFTTVTLFLSTFFVAMLRPHFWHIFDSWTGRAIVVALFLIGVWHLASRLRAYLERYTYRPKPIQDSIMHDDEEKDEKPFTRLTAYAFLLVGYIASLGAGLYIGAHAEIFIGDLGFFFRQHVRSELLLYPPASLIIPDLLLYPPIAVLIVDTMHTIAAKIDP